ncbi:MAG: energy transducer TonB [Candidatus Omnitrophica bacterium]|nr:energy transducer TonB [Candidatus Omnitrophota bacterium]
MFSDRAFQIAFVISLVAHGVIFLQNPDLSFLPLARQEESLKVTYIRKQKEARPPQRKLSLPRREPLLEVPSKVSPEKRLPAPFTQNRELLRPKDAAGSANLDFAKPNLIKPDIIAVKRRITLPEPDKDKINNPTYMNYYQIVREKIKRAAYQNYSGTETGEVNISFIISNDGYLKDLRLSEEMSADNAYLRETALRSVKEAAPFPNFPSELDYPQLSFNLAINFEIE